MTSEPEELLSIDHYIKKTFYKTASLMANSCKAVAILGNQPREDCQLAWEYGRHLGLAFQVSRLQTQSTSFSATAVSHAARSGVTIGYNLKPCSTKCKGMSEYIHVFIMYCV